MPEQQHEARHRQSFEEHHRRLHEEHTRRNVGNNVEQHLRHRRIDGVGVVAAVHVVEQILIRLTQKCEGRITGDITIGIDVRVLNDSIPRVPIDIGRQNRIAKERYQTTRNGEAKNQGEGVAVSIRRLDEEDCHGR